MFGWFTWFVCYSAILIRFFWGWLFGCYRFGWLVVVWVVSVMLTCDLCVLLDIMVFAFVV